MPNKLPQGWVECQLGEVFDIRDGTHDSPKYHDIGYPLVTSKNLKNGLIDLENVSLISEKDYNKINERSKVSIGDILFAMIGTIGNPVIIVDEPQFAIKNVALFKYNNLINNKYLKYFLESSKTLNIMHSQAKGSTQKFVGLGYLRTFIFPVCPLNEQKRIVEKIESEFAKIDEGVEHLEHAKEQLKQYRQSVLKSAFSNCSSYIKVGELCEVVRGGSPRPAGDEKYYNGHIPFLKVADITKDNNKYLNEYTYTIKEAGLKKTRLVNANTLLLSNSGATLGVPKICTFATTFNDGIAAFLGLSNETLDFHYYYWLSKTKELRCINQGAAQPNLNTDIIKEQLIPNLNKFEQKEIVEEIEKRFAIADEVEKVVEDNIEKAKQLKQSILKKAFEGNLVPQEPTDEPASTLLEKIKQERSKK